MVNPSICPPDTDFSPAGTYVELADVVRRFGHQYTSQYEQVMMPSQKRALSDIAACCTKELGGRLYHCDDCRGTFWSFHCCRNRSCPKCHGKQTQEWLEKRQAELLPCDYFHAVATVPSQLRDALGVSPKRDISWTSASTVLRCSNFLSRRRGGHSFMLVVVAKPSTQHGKEVRHADSNGIPKPRARFFSHRHH
jgi:hypothetical protein